MLVLTFQIGSTCLALDVRRIHEVVPWSSCSALNALRPGLSAFSFIVAAWCRSLTCIV